MKLHRLLCFLVTMIVLVSVEARAQELDVLWADRLGTNPSTLAWLAGDMDGDGDTDILHPWNNNGTLGLHVYQSTGMGYVHSFASSNMGQGSTSALGWLTGDMDGDGRTDIFHPFDNKGRLGLIVYRSDGTSYATAFGSANMGTGSGGLVQFLTGDADGDGLTDLIHLWKNGSQLGMFVYRSTGTGYSLWFSNSNMGQGWNALKWLAGDMDGDGRTDIFQPFNNNGALGLIAYRATGTGYTTVFAVANIGQGSASLLDLLVGDMDGDRRTDIFHIFNNNNNGRVGLIVYRSSGTGFTTEFGSSDMGMITAGTAAWRAGDVDGDGRTDIFQPRSHFGNVEVNIYLSSGTGYFLGYSECCFGQLSHLGWLVGSFDGGNRESLLHLWSHTGTLALVVYGLRSEN